VNNGERFTTYAIRAERGTGTISVNDAAARKTVTEDMLIIVVYVMRNEIEAQILEPEMVYAYVIIHITRHSGQIATKWAV
jgi:aspartate 1-decarboxylase